MLAVEANRGVTKPLLLADLLSSWRHCYGDGYVWVGPYRSYVCARYGAQALRQQLGCGAARAEEQVRRRW